MVAFTINASNFEILAKAYIHRGISYFSHWQMNVNHFFYQQSHRDHISSHFHHRLVSM